MTSHLTRLDEYFSKPASIKATGPLRKGLEIAIQVEDEKGMLKKGAERVQVSSGNAEKPDMTILVPAAALDKLIAGYSDDIGEIGISILKLMAGATPAEKITVKLHIGIWDFIRGGYLGILPLGGPSVMKFLASKGLTGIGKIKDALSRLRQDR